jgi:hypothetical protein
MVDAHHHAVRPQSGMPLDLLVFLKLAAAVNSAGYCLTCVTINVSTAQCLAGSWIACMRATRSRCNCFWGSRTPRRMLMLVRGLLYAASTGI